MSDGTIILDTGALTNLYIGGGTQAWDALLNTYSNVVIPHQVITEMTTQVKNPMYPKDGDFAKWLSEHQGEVSTPKTDVADKVKEGDLKPRDAGEKAVAEVANGRL